MRSVTETEGWEGMAPAGLAQAPSGPAGLPWLHPLPLWLKQMRWEGREKPLFKTSISHNKILIPPSPSPTSLLKKDRLSARLPQNGASQLPRALCLGWGFRACRAVGRGVAEPFSCYQVPEPSLHFPHSKASPCDGLLGIKQEVWQQPPQGVAGHSARGQLVTVGETWIQGKLPLNFWLMNLNLNTGWSKRWIIWC